MTVCAGPCHADPMGRIVYAMLTSADGYIADADGELTLPPPGPELHRHFNEDMRRVALSIYGRRMFEMMTYWGEPDPDRDEVAQEFADLWMLTPTAVVSTTLDAVPEGMTLIREDVVAHVRRLKDATDGEIEVCGAELAATVGAAGLIDEYVMYVQPMVLGAGRPFFAEGFTPDLRFLGAETLPEGVVALRYAPA